MTDPKRYGYVCTCPGRDNWETYADSQYAALQKALEHFKPRKSVRHRVSAHLAEIDGQPVSQVITS